MPVERCGARHGPTECRLCRGEIGAQGLENRTCAAGCGAPAAQRPECPGVGPLPPPAAPRGGGRRAAAGRLAACINRCPLANDSRSTAILLAATTARPVLIWEAHTTKPPVCLHNSAAPTDKSGGFGSLHTCLVGPRPPAGGTTS